MARGEENVEEEEKFKIKGVEIRRPTTRSVRAAADPRSSYLCWPTWSGEDGDTAPLSDQDAETLAVFQELGFQHAMEQTRSAVRAILLRVNEKCYIDAHAFLQRHMQRVDPRRARSPAVPRVVAFASLMKLPVVAIVSGSDATFNDVWMTPLCQVIHRSFPVILVLRDDVAGVRRLVEWVMERLDDYSGMKKREEAWLIQQVESRSAIAEYHQNGNESTIPPPHSVPCNEPKRRLRERPGRAASTKRTSIIQFAAQDDSDDEYKFFTVSSSSSDSDEYEAARARTSARHQNGSKRKRRSKSGPRRRMKYRELLLDDLLLKLRRKMRIIRRQCDSTATWTATLREVIHVDLNERLLRCELDIEESIKYYNETIEWVKSRIVAYRNLRPLPLSIRAATAEFSLATLAFRIMADFLSFLRTAAPRTQEQTELVDNWKRQVEIQLARHEDAYHLHQFQATQHEDVGEQLDPFLLICIEHLDRFKLQILRDFVDLWSHFASLRPEHGHSTRIGFIVGVTTTTSQTLRQLGLSVVRRLDIQFFPLEDSMTRSDDILESLFVENHFPLCLRGGTLRLLHERHLTSQSLTAFMHVLEYIALSHFQDTPWSFLSRFNFEFHCRKALGVAGASPAVRRWVGQAKFRGRSLPDFVSQFSDEGVQFLQLRIGGSMRGKDIIRTLDEAIVRSRRRQSYWTAGWKCFRAACAWFDLGKRFEGFVECLATCMDGKAIRLKAVEWITMMINTQPVDLVAHVLKDWAAVVSSEDSTLRRNLEDLIALAEHIINSRSDPETKQMLPLFRQELIEFFHVRILPMMNIDSQLGDDIHTFVSDCVVAAASTSKTDAHVQLNLHEDIIRLLDSLDGEDYQGSSHVSDLSLAFMYYREHPTLQLNVSEWFDAFASAVNEEVAARSSNANAEINSDELNARFARALATLRLWGFIRVRGNSRRHEDTVVDKMIFV